MIVYLEEKYNDVTITESDINESNDDKFIKQIDDKGIYNDNFDEEENIEVSDVFFTLEMRDIELVNNYNTDNQHLELTEKKRAIRIKFNRSFLLV